MRHPLCLLALAALAVLPTGAAFAQEQQPPAEPKPAPITVLKDSSPAMYGRSAKVKAVVEAVDVPGRHITIKGPRGRAVSMRVESRVRNLADVAVGDEVTVRYHESVGVEVRKAEPGETLPVEIIQTNSSETANAGSRLSVIANVESSGTREKTLVLKDDEGRFYDLYVRDHALLESFKHGDRVFASYTEAAVVSIDLPKDKDAKDPKAKKKKK